MSSLSDILSNIQGKIFKEIGRKTIVKNTILKISKVDLDIDNISIKNEKLHIKVFGVEKLEIINKKDIILEDLKKNNVFLSDIV